MDLAKVFRENKIIISVLAMAVFIFGYCLTVFYSFGYQSDNESIGVTLMFVAVAIYPVLWLIANPSKFKAHVAVVTLMLIGIVGVVLIVLFLVTDYARQNYLRKELDKNGIKTTAVVTGFEYDYIKSSRIDYATIQYEFENGTIVQRIKDINHIYKLDQVIPIRFSREHEEMFEITEDGH